MAEPKIAQRSPYVLRVEPGTLFWCACGHSQSQPFCDGSHRGTGITPVKVEVTEPGSVAFCGCKHSGKGHLCDGTHRTL